MALGLAALQQLHDVNDLSQYVTASYTPTASRLLVAFIATRGAQADPTSVAGNGVTWYQKAAVNQTDMRLMLYVALSGGSPSAGALTVTYSGTQTGQHISIFEMSGVYMTDGALAAIIQSPTATGTGTTGTVNLSLAGQPSTLPISAWCHAANEATTPRTSWTEIHDGNFATPASGMETQWYSTTFEITASATWATSSAWAGIAAEVRISEVVVATDLTMISSCDTTGAGGTWDAGTVDSDAKVEGVACLYVKYTSTGAKTITFTPTAALNIPTGSAIYFWVAWAAKSMPNTKAAGGLALRLVTSTNVWSEWLVAGSDTLPHNGWVCHVVDTSVTPDTTGSTSGVTLSNVTSIQLKCNLVVKGNFSWDVFRHGTKMTIWGGSVATPANFAAAVTIDSANAYGFISLAEGVYFCQGKFQIGTTAAGCATYFKSTSRVLAFANKIVSASFYDIAVVGNASATTKVYMGTKSGTKGISGNVFKPAATSRTFTFTATDSNITDLGLYGCSFISASTISLPAYSSTREVLNCNFEACAEILPSTCTMTYCNIISSVDRGLRIVASHQVTNCSFISCPYAVRISSTGTYTFNALSFAGNTCDVDNDSGGTVTVDSQNWTSPPSTYTGTTILRNNVTLTVDVENEAGNPVIGAAVYIEKTSDKTVLMSEYTVLTDGKGRAQEVYLTYVPPAFAINVRVRKSSL